MDAEPDEIEVERQAEIDGRFWLAARARLIALVGTDDDGDPVYDVTETGWARARAIAFECGVNRETLTEAQAIALVTEIVGIA